MATKQFPYAPKVVADYLRANLGGIKVSTDVPKTWTPPLVTITMVPANSTPNLVLSTRRLIIHCWHSKELDGGNLIERVRQLLVDVPYVGGVPGLRNVNIIGEPGRYDDPDSSIPRFEMTADVLLRALTN